MKLLFIVAYENNLLIKQTNCIKVLICFVKWSKLKWQTFIKLRTIYESYE